MQVLIAATTRDGWLNGDDAPISPGEVLACDGLPRGQRLVELTLFSTYVTPFPTGFVCQGFAAICPWPNLHA